MDSSQLMAQVLQEVQRIPVERLPEVYRLIHAFRLQTETETHSPNSIMQFAGSWSNLSDETYADLITDIETRRQQAFSERRMHETRFD
ncbi:MAG: hypothetical protein HC827_14530 [Cyanobacteria bacterium RM1_2_2]|nr:hypothetical protein [Cyanobacteria bacterium RM1_2_2]